MFFYEYYINILYYYLTVPEVELTPKEIAESIVDDMLDAIFPAEAAAREFLDRLLERLDRELLPKGKSRVVLIGLSISSGQM